jgi:CHRD domain
MSSKLRRSLLVLAISALLVVPFAAVTQVQDTELTTCDSTLLLLVLLAERDYGYTPTMDVSGFERGQFTPFFDDMMADMGGEMSMATPDPAMATADPAMATRDGSTSTEATVDPMMATPDASIATADGSTGSSDASMATPDPTMATPDASMATPDGSTATDATADPSMATVDPMMGSMVQLLPGNVTGEDANCAALRADVEAYLFSNLSMGGMNMGGDMGAGMSDSGAGNDMAMGMELTATLDGAQEVPGPGDEDGSGSASITINADTNEVCYDIQVTGITLPAAAAHIHVGSAGTAGGVVVPLDAPNADGTVSGCAAADPSIVQGLLTDPSIYYVNVHTSDFPDGAVRGQLGGM